MVLLQTHNGEWKPIAFASRSLTDTECRYAQIEKEELAVTWVCEKFAEYILRKQVQLETDHKPLVPSLGKKSLDSLLPQVLRFCLCLMRFEYTMNHVPGNELYTPDTLSRAPVNDQPDSLAKLSAKDVELFIHTLTDLLPDSKDRLQVYQQAQASETVCSKLIEYCKSDWPTHKPKGPLGKY